MRYTKNSGALLSRWLLTLDLELAQIEARVVGEHFGQIEELRHNLLHVGHAPSRGRAFPGMLDVVEETICVVEFPA